MDDPALDLARALGAEAKASEQILSLYIPNKDRNGRHIDSKPWIREAERLLARIGEGYTTTPPHDGGWETATGIVKRERTVVVFTYIKPERFLQHLGHLRRFLHRFGRETNQEVVVVELSGGGQSWFFRIKRFDPQRRTTWRVNLR